VAEPSRRPFRAWLSEGAADTNVLQYLDRGAVMSSTSLDSQSRPAAARTSDIVMMDGVALARAIRSRQISCVDVMTAYLDHIERLNPQVTWRPSKACE
jgi:hypothetical protein